MMQAMKICALFFLSFLLPVLPGGSAFASPGALRMTAGELKEMCNDDENKCLLWIQGVAEGMEFAGIALPPKKHKIGHNILNFKNYVEDMYGVLNVFMNAVEAEEFKNMLDQPAVLTLTIGFRKHLCRSKEECSENPFVMPAGALGKICEGNVPACTLWIEGVVEGMEFFKLMTQPPQAQPENPLFCMENFEAGIKAIREDFTTSFRAGQGGERRDDDPAVIALAPFLQEHACK